MHRRTAYWIGLVLVSITPFMVEAQEPPSGVPAQSQSANAPASAANAETKAQKEAQKNALKAQRKAERKQARQVKNEELKNLERNGYGPRAEPDQYPENLLNAERKSAVQKSAPASSP